MVRYDVRDLAGLDRVIHEPGRLMIVAVLSGVERADYLFLQRETGLTKGNLSAHLVRLQSAGYVAIEKTFRGRVPLTVCWLTPEGRRAFRGYRRCMRRLVESSPDSAGGGGGSGGQGEDRSVTRATGGRQPDPG
jgi:DNA-binding transcriptional ArsR family regulator